MEKRELSSTLRNLKFMQRAVQREEKPKKEEEQEVKPDDNFFSPGAVNKRCVVVMEGDPHPGSIIGRMSFQSFNPSVDKLYEEPGNTHKPEAPATSSGSQNGNFSFRENGSLNGESLNFDQLNYEADGDLKRKHPEEVLEKDLPNKSPKTVEDGQHSSPHNNKTSSFKQPKRKNLDWNVLRPSMGKNRRAGRGLCIYVTYNLVGEWDDAVPVYERHASRPSTTK